MYGYYTLKGWLNGPNSLAGSKEGNITLKLKDGTTYKFEQLLMVINNLIAGSQYQTYMNHGYITDITNNIQCDIRYNPWADNTYTGMFKRAFKSKWLPGFGGSKKKEEQKEVKERSKRADDIHIEIV